VFEREYSNTWRQWLYLGIWLPYVLQTLKGAFSAFRFRGNMEREACQ